MLGLCAPPKFRYSSKCFAAIYRAQYENAMLVYPRGTESNVNIWNLLWLSRRMIISIEQTSIYASTFRRSVSSKFIEICMGRHVGAHPDGHQHGGRKPTETSVNEFCYKSVS